MSYVSNYRLRAFVQLSLCFAVWSGYCLTAAAAALPQADEQMVIRRLVESYFAAYRKEDVEGVMSMWSAKSPDVAATRQLLQQTFAGVEKITVNIVKLGKATVAADEARIRIEVEIGAVDAKTGQPAVGFGKLHRTLELVREGREWKVWRLVASEDELAASLVAAGSEDERRALLVSEKELVTVELQKALVRHGQRLSNQGGYGQALIIYRLALQIAEQLGDQRGVAITLRNIGIVYRSQGDYMQALEYYRKSLKLAEKVGDRSLIAPALNNIGVVHALQGDYAQALEYYQKSLKLREEIGDKAALAPALNNIGNIFNAQGNYAQALEYYRKSLKLVEEIGDKGAIATTLGNIGSIYNSQSNYTQALEFYQRSLKLLEELGNKAGIANTLNNIGAVNYVQGDYTQALEYYRKSLKLAEEIGDKSLIATALDNVGIVYRSEGEYTLALEFYQKSLKLAEASGEKTGIANTLNNIGGAHELQGNYAQALEYYLKSLKLAEETGEKRAIARTLNNIGLIHNAQGNYAQALDYYQKSLKLAEEISDKAAAARMLNNIGIVHTSQGSYTQALEFYRRSLRLADEAGDKALIASVLDSIGDIHNAQGNHTQAMETYRKSLKLREELGDKTVIANTLHNIGDIYNAQGNYVQALKVADRAALIANQIGSPERFREARITAGKAYRGLNQPEQARQAFDDAISTIERLRTQVAGNEHDQQRFFENKLAPYHQMVALLILQNRMTEALAYAERSKGRVLLDVLRNGRTLLTRAMTRTEQEQERKLNSEIIALNTRLSQQKLQRNPDVAQLAALNAHLEKTRLEYESFQTSLYAAHPELKVQRGESPPLDLKEAAQLLPDDGKAALLEYVIADENSFLFVLTKAAPASRRKTSAVTLKVYPLNIKSKELSELVETFQKRLGERNLAFSVLAQRLYELLLKPARLQLQGTDMLCIVPDGVLWQLPFQALKTASGRYLIEDQAVFYAPSLTTLREMIEHGKRNGQVREPASTSIPGASRRGARPLARTVSQQQSPPTLLAFGNPLFNPQAVARRQALYRDEELGALPEAEKEVNALRELYGAARSRVYTGAEAREERVKAEIGNYRVIHFATHALLDNRSPLYSHLLLAQETGDSGEDGLLEAREIMKMDLQADLVVLSACQTAGGRVGAGEGVIGMTWALFVAGAPTTLVSQWKVDTRSTSKLMVEFHGHLQRERRRSTVVRKAEALRQAMLTLLRSKEYELPYYWAPFVLVGNGF
jgi:CHAT domain-containing protein/Tfp pilus assembly protein PilF